LLQHACFFGKHEVIPVLLAAGCDPSAKEKETGWTALHFAAVDGYADCIKELFKSDKVRAKRRWKNSSFAL
jgi:ankyrin repeat protein